MCYSGADFFSYFPPLKPKCVLRSGESYSPKNAVYVLSNSSVVIISLYMYITSCVHVKLIQFYLSIIPH